jgi:hypothetical protein
MGFNSNSNTNTNNLPNKILNKMLNMFIKILLKFLLINNLLNSNNKRNKFRINNNCNRQFLSKISQITNNNKISLFITNSNNSMFSHK